jgi:polyphenol oxidase
MTRLETVRREGVEFLEAVGDGWRACFSTRLGGVSQGPYAELDLSLMVGDEAGRVLENRARLGAAAGFDATALVISRQVHGVHVVTVTSAQRGSGALEQESSVPDTDALLTSTPELPLVVSTADCVPVVLAARGEQGAAVAVAHAGWRGMVTGIIADAVVALRACGAITAAIVGPSIGPCCFTVGDDVGRAFEDRYAGTWRDGRVDLWLVAERQLAAAGVPADCVSNPRLCTVCDRRFFSHRRDAGRTGRQAGVAWVTADRQADLGMPAGAGGAGEHSVDCRQGGDGR